MVAGHINYLHTMLSGEALQTFYELYSQNNGTTNAHLKEIQESLLVYFIPLNAVSKQKCVMHRNIPKPHGFPFKIFSARLTELEKFLPMFPGLYDSKSMNKYNLNEVLLHIVPNGWAKHSYLRGRDFEKKKPTRRLEMCSKECKSWNKSIKE